MGRSALFRNGGVALSSAGSTEPLSLNIQLSRSNAPDVRVENSNNTNQNPTCRHHGDAARQSVVAPWPEICCRFLDDNRGHIVLTIS